MTRSRQRKKLRQRAAKEQANLTPQEETPRGQGLSGDLLTEPHNLLRDIALTGSAIKQRWPIDEAKRGQLIERLMGVVLKETVTVPTKDGIFNLDGPADSNAVAASRVLVAAMAQNQADEHAAIPKEGTTVNVAVMGAAVAVEVDDDWYGNAKRLNKIAARDGADASGTPVESHP